MRHANGQTLHGVSKLLAAMAARQGQPSEAGTTASFSSPFRHKVFAIPRSATASASLWTGLLLAGERAHST